ncbi:MAG TPA: hypothetical protein V6C52_03680 [Coleofasciculaceae cyanobacterium]
MITSHLGNTHPGGALSSDVRFSRRPKGDHEWNEFERTFPYSRYNGINFVYNEEEFKSLPSIPAGRDAFVKAHSAGLALISDIKQKQSRDGNYYFLLKGSDAFINQLTRMIENVANIVTKLRQLQHPGIDHRIDQKETGVQNNKMIHYFYINTSSNDEKVADLVENNDFCPLPT